MTMQMRLMMKMMKRRPSVSQPQSKPFQNPSCSVFRTSLWSLHDLHLFPICFFLSDHKTTPTDILNKIKAGAITHLLRKLFVNLALTKSQMDTMNRFIRCLIVFLSPQNQDVASNIHAGYLSCQRESVKQHIKRDVYVDNCFATCKYFSLAIDTSLFGQEHVLACTTRFVFDKRIEQFNLFFSVCRASTGEELAQFVFDKLKGYNVPFTKLTSIATDGAKI